ncbi:MAG: hypothetical protein R6V10_14740 [bacterium]
MKGVVAGHRSRLKSLARKILSLEGGRKQSKPWISWRKEGDMGGKVLGLVVLGFFLVSCFLIAGCPEDSSENPELYCNSETNRLDLVEVTCSSGIANEITIDGDPSDWAAAGIESINSQIECLANPVSGLSPGVGELYMSYCEEGWESSDKYVLYMFVYSDGEIPVDADASRLFFSPDGRLFPDDPPANDDITFDIRTGAGGFYTYDTGSPIHHVLDPAQYAVNEASGVIEVKVSLDELGIGGSFPYDPVSLAHYCHIDPDSYFDPLGTYWVDF